MRRLLVLGVVSILAVLALWPGGALAAHDLSQSCYVCHNIQGGTTWSGSNSIWTGQSIGMAAYSRPITCDICHVDHKLMFDNSALGGSEVSAHPVELINGATMTSYFGYGMNVRCLNCHSGNTETSLSPDLSPDVAPQSYTTNSGTDGYPNHDVLVPNNNWAPGDPPHLSAVYDNTPAATGDVATKYALCFGCHDGSTNTTRQKNVLQEYLDKGHYFKTAGSFGASSWSAGDRISCSDCHASHRSGDSSRLMAPKLSSGSWPGVVYNSASNPDNASIRAMCVGCHDDTTTTPNGTPRIRGVEPSVAPATVSAHITYSGTKTTEACTGCHSPHRTPAGGDDCLNCHRTGGPVQVRHQQADLEFQADGSPGEDNPAVQLSGHEGVLYSAPYDTKALNECKKCHGTSHPSSAAKVQQADGSTTYSTGFIYGLSYNAGSWSANSASFLDNNSNGIIDGNEFCLSCHDGSDALSPTDNANIRIGGVNPPKAYFPQGGSSSGHDRKGGINYTVSNNPPGQQLCTACHKYHVSDRPRLFPGNAGPYGAGNAYTYAMPSWSALGTTWQAPRPASASPNDRPQNAGRIRVGNRYANSEISFADRSNPASGRGFGTAGSTKTTFDGLCDACHRDAATVSANTDNVAHTHEGDGAGFGSRNIFVKDCVECHNPHGGGPTPNLFMIRQTVGRDNTSQNPVVFTAQTGADSYDEADIQNADDLCATCHNNPPIAHNYRVEASSSSHNQGTNCVTCHPHGATDNAAKFGFPQGSCTTCHGDAATGRFWPDSAPANLYMDRAGAHSKHVDAIYGANSGTLPGATATDKKNAVCNWCHPNPGGQNVNGNPHDTNTTGSSDNTADLHKDGFNPATSFKALTGGPDADGAYNPSTKQCSAVDCHGGSTTFSWYYVSDNAAPVWTPDSGIGATNPNLGGALNVTWRRAVDAYPSNPVLYYLYVSDNAATVFSGSPVYAGLQDNSATVTALTNGTTYYFGVRAKDSWPIPNVTTNTDVSTGVAPTGGGGGSTTTAYFLRKDTGTTLWGTTQTNGNACSTLWSVAAATPTTNPPPARGLLSAAKRCANSTNNYLTPSAAYTGYRNLAGFYRQNTSGGTIRVTGRATGNSVGVRSSSGTEDVRIYLATVASNGTHTLSSGFAEYLNVPTTTPPTHWQPNLSAVTIDVPNNTWWGVIVQFADSNSLSNNDQVTLDAYDTTRLDQVTLTEGPLPDTTPPAFNPGPLSAIVVQDAISGGTLNISWSPATDGGTPNTPPVTYDLYRSTVLANLWTSPYRAGLGVTSLQDTGLTNGLTYYYGVRAKDSYSPPNATTNIDNASGVPTKGSTFGCDSCHNSPPTAAGNTGSHPKHVSSAKVAQYDYTDCDKCHPGASSYANSHQDGIGQLGFSGTAYNAIYGTPTPSTLRYNNGTADFYVDNTGYGILTGSAGDNTDNGTCSSTNCHGTSTPVWGSAGSVTCGSCHTNGTLVTPNAPTVNTSSSHVDADGSGGTWANGDCKGCHSGHFQGVRIPLPPTSWSNANLPSTNMRTRLGIDYATVDGIYLGGPGTAASINGKTTEAEICWGCHDSLSTRVSEWGYNTKTTPAGYPRYQLSTTNDGKAETFNFGWIYTNTTYSYATGRASNWVTGASGGTAPYWRSEYESHLTMRIVSVHSASFDTTEGAGQISSVASNVNGSTGAVNYSSPALEEVKMIRCSYCHDVHRLGRNGYSPPSKPYLRGTWVGNPYAADMPPRTSQGTAYPSTGGPGRIVGNRFINTQSPMPRPYAYSYPSAQADNVKGGYFIDANSGNPTDNASLGMDTVGKFAGLCTLCHGTVVNTMDYYGSSNLWIGSNGHANSTRGGTGSGKANLFDARRGAAGSFMGVQDAMTVTDWGVSFSPQPKSNDVGGWNNIFQNPQPCSGTNNANCPPRNSGWYGGPIGNAHDRSGDYSNWYSASGIGSRTGTAGGKAHDFTCSKCHTPHASGLPALLVTNCLDRTLADWTTNSGRVGPNGTASGNNAMNCHRKTSNTDGWNRLAPGTKF